MRKIFLFFLGLVIIKTALAGLFKDSDLSYEIPLNKVTVHSKIKDTIAEVYVQQTYTNDNEENIEAIYKFPLDSEAAVESFEADIDGETFKAKIYKNDEANKIYDKEVENGNNAFLLSEEYNDVFQVNIGNLKPKQTVHIKLTYVTELNSGNESNKVTFVLPNIIAPRYGSNNSTISSRILKGNPVYTENVDYTLHIDVELEMSGKINSIESPSHEIISNISEKKNNEAIVTLKSDKVYLDKDFILDIEAEELSKSKVLIEYNEELQSYASLLTLMPNLIQNENLKVEIVFLIDQSGSMHGWKLNYLKDALTLFLKSMPIDSYFNIITFGSLYESLFEKSVKYNEESLNKAMEYIKDMDASMGGTEMRDPLEYIYSTEIPEGYHRSIFLLTDGEIWDVDPVIDLVRENTEKQNSVLYTFGIGKSVSHYLVSSIARNGNGMSLFVTEGERLEKKVLLQLKNVLVPYIQNYTLSWKEKDTTTTISSDELEQTPYKAPLMRYGSRYSIYALSKKPLVPSPINLTYQLSDGTTQTEVITFDQVKELKNGKLIHSLAAANLIKDLQEGTSKFHYSDEYKKRVESDEQITKMFEKIKEKIIEISTKYQIMSKYTSFLCVKEEKQDSSSSDPPKKIIIPSKGIPMTRDQAAPKPLSYHKKRTFSGVEYVTRDIPMEEANAAATSPESEEVHFRENENSFDVSDINLIKMPKANPEEKEKSQRLLFNNLIQYQNYDGSFKLSDLLSSIIGPIYGKEFSSEWKKELDGIEENYKEVYPAIVDQFDKLIGTSISCIILTDYLGELQNEWELVKEKSENWIKQQQQQNPIQDVRQKILISIKQQKDHLLSLLKTLQNDDGSFVFTSIKETILDRYYGKVLTDEWVNELKEIEGQVLPTQWEEFNKFIGSVLTLNILNNEKFEEASAEPKQKEQREVLLKRLSQWVETQEKQNPIFHTFIKDIENSLQFNKKKRSLIHSYVNSPNTTSFSGNSEALTCYRDLLRNKVVVDQSADGSFSLYDILDKLKDLELEENSAGSCQKEYQEYSHWVKEWFVEVDSVLSSADKEHATDEEKKFINELWGTLVAIRIQEEITSSVIRIHKNDISDVDTFKQEFLYQNQFDKAQGWLKDCFNDPKNIPFISKWWIEPDEKEPTKKKEEKKSSTGHDEL